MKSNHKYIDPYLYVECSRLFNSVHFKSNIESNNSNSRSSFNDERDWIIAGFLALLGLLMLLVAVLVFKLRRANQMILKMIKLVPKSDQTATMKTQSQGQGPTLQHFFCFSQCDQMLE